MADLKWTDYVAVGTSAIGAITGIVGAILGSIGYRKANSLKALDLRLELRKAVSDLGSLSDELPNLIDSANRSRKSIAAATGNFRSGMMEKWNKDIEADKIRLQQLSVQIPAVGDAFVSHSHTELESVLVEVHSLHTVLKQLQSKYRDAIQADDETRIQIRADQRARMTQG